MPDYLRVKHEGCLCTEIDISKLTGFSVTFNEETEEYALIGLVNAVMYVLITGTFDSCHFLLNKIHNTLDINIIDL